MIFFSAAFPSLTPQRMDVSGSDRGSIQQARYPALSPDGTQVAFACLIGEYFHLCLAPLGQPQGVVLVSNLADKRTGKDSIPGSPVWSPDGGWLYFSKYYGGDWDIFRVAASGGTPENLTSSWSGSYELMPAVRW